MAFLGSQASTQSFYQTQNGMVNRFPVLVFGGNVVIGILDIEFKKCFVSAKDLKCNNTKP